MYNLDRFCKVRQKVTENTEMNVAQKLAKTISCDLETMKNLCIQYRERQQLSDTELNKREIKDNWKIETKGNTKILIFNHVIIKCNAPKSIGLRTDRLYISHE